MHIRDLQDDYYRHDESQYALVGTSTGRVYRLADPVRVQIIRVDEEDRKIDMIIAPEESEESKTRGRRKKKNK